MGIRSFINRNSTAIVIVVIVVIFLLLGIKLLNYFYEEQEKENSIKYGNNNSSKNYTIGNNYTLDNIQKSETDNLTGDSLENAMKLFVASCNKGDISSAYSFLTDECKEVFNYTSEDDFDKYYLKKRFSESQEYSMVKWSKDGKYTTYLINFFGDMMATGGDQSSVQEYYTFFEENGIYKININNFIYSTNKNKEYNDDNIYIKIGKINIFATYEEAEIEIRNKTENKMCLTGDKSTKKLYLENKLGTKYSAINNEFDYGNVVMDAKDIKKYKVKFNKSYSISNSAKYLTFNDIILNYDEYLSSNNKTNYTNRTTITMDY